jgi:hypothetical protein
MESLVQSNDPDGPIWWKRRVIAKAAHVFFFLYSPAAVRFAWQPWHNGRILLSTMRKSGACFSRTMWCRSRAGLRWQSRQTAFSGLLRNQSRNRFQRRS